MSEKKEIAQAIIEVMKAVKGMEKNSSVGSGNYGYKGTKDQDVKEVFNTELAKNGLSILPISIEPNTTIERWEEGGRTKQSVFTEVKTKYLLLHTSGESIELAGFGQGVDAQDKGAGKATTYALKNCLLYTFLTPVGKIDDTDTTHSNETSVPQKAIVKTKISDFDFEGKVNTFKTKVEIVNFANKYELSEVQKSAVTLKHKELK